MPGPIHSVAGLLAGACVLLATYSGAVSAGEPPLRRLLSFDAATQTAWGERYEHGEGVRKDPGKAVRLYCAAARRGFARAQYRLGWMYANGRGVARDDGLAAAWFRLAAKQGDLHAQRMLPHLAEPAKPRAASCVGASGTDVEVHAVSIDSPHRRAVAQSVKRIAVRYALDPALVLAVIHAESGFDTRAVSPKGAMGLMQLMPATAERFGVRDAFDPEQNLKGGMAYLRWLLDHFDGKVPLAVAAYNAGEEAVNRYGGIPPYEETRTYVQRVSRLYPDLRHPTSRDVKVAKQDPAARDGDS